jgi:hypothetical protein
MLLFIKRIIAKNIYDYNILLRYLQIKQKNSLNYHIRHLNFYLNQNFVFNFIDFILLRLNLFDHGS